MKTEENIWTQLPATEQANYEKFHTQTYQEDIRHAEHNLQIIERLMQ